MLMCVYVGMFVGWYVGCLVYWYLVCCLVVAWCVWAGMFEVKGVEGSCLGEFLLE